MKCNTCKYCCYHNAGSWVDVSEGCDDPYDYQYCAKDHWCGDNMLNEDESIDYWESCSDYQRR